MIRNIVKVVRTCSACPAQWDMWDSFGFYYYVRYRHSVLRVYVAESEDDWFKTAEAPIIEEKLEPGDMGGFLSYPELKEILENRGFAMPEARDCNGDWEQEGFL
jgi:hypothetical protein